MSWWIILAGVVVNWGMMVSETEQKIGRGKLQVSTSERKYGSQVSLWGKNNYLLPYPATIWLSLWLHALSVAMYLNVGVHLEISLHSKGIELRELAV
jgi:hypothetical protein